MAKKKSFEEMDIGEKFISQYKELVSLNQRLKNICEIYYIGYNGTIYMKSLVPFINKIAFIDNIESLSMFYGCLILPNKLFEFTKNAKKTKLCITEKDHNIELSQSDNDDISFIIHKGYYFDLGITENEYINNNIIPKFSPKLFNILGDNIDFKDYHFNIFTPDEVESIISDGICYSYTGNIKIGETFDITKMLFIDAKSDDIIGITNIDYSDDFRNYVLIMNQCSQYTIYTITACLKNI